MKCGYSKINIDPPIGMPIAGGYVPKYSIGSIDPLFVRAAAFSDGSETALLIAVDLCYMGTDIHAACRESIARECGVPEEAIIITCSHTHAGPHVGKGAWNSEFDTAPYISELIGKITKAAISAVSDLKEAKFYSAIGEAKGISFIRRYRMKDGSVVTNPPKHSPEIDHPLGTPNDEVRLVKIVREGGRELNIVGFGTHACMVGGYRMSADFPGVVCEMLESCVKDSDCMFIVSAQGDVNHVDPFPSEEALAMTERDLKNDSIYRARATHVGGSIAGEVLKIRTLAKKISVGGVSFARRIMQVPTNKSDDDYGDALAILKIYDEGRASELPYKDMALTTVIANAKRVVKMRTAPDFYTYPMTAISLGEIIFLGITGEPFVDIGRRITEASPYGQTMLACLSNAMSTYFPTSAAMREGGYEAVTSDIGVGADDIIVETAKDIFAELYKEN